VNREIREPRERKFKYAEGVTEISPVLVRQQLRRENVAQNNSFSASDGEKVAGGRMRCPQNAGEDKK